MTDQIVSASAWDAYFAAKAASDAAYADAMREDAWATYIAAKKAAWAAYAAAYATSTSQT